MSLNLKVGNRISFRYTAGTHPMAERDLVITSLDGHNVSGFDFSVDVNGERVGAYRNFNRPKMVEIYVKHKDWLTEECKCMNEILKRFESVRTLDLIADLNAKFGNIFVADGRKVVWKQEKKDEFSLIGNNLTIKTKDDNVFFLSDIGGNLHLRVNNAFPKKVESLSHLLDMLGYIPF